MTSIETLTCVNIIKQQKQFPDVVVMRSCNQRVAMLKTHLKAVNRQLVLH